MVNLLKEIYYNLKSLNIKAEDSYLMVSILDNLEKVINNFYLSQQQEKEQDKKE